MSPSHDCDNDKEQHIRNNQEFSDEQNETEKHGDSEEDTNEDFSDSEGDIDPYGKQLSVVREKQKMLDCEIPLEDASPITFCALLSEYAKDLPDFKINFNLKMLFLVFVVLPFCFYLKIALVVFYRLDFYHEYYKKVTNLGDESGCKKRTTIFRIVCLTMGVSWKEILTFGDITKLIGLISLFVILLFIRPKDFLYHTELITECVFNTWNNCQPVSLGDEILKHLKINATLGLRLNVFHSLEASECIEAMSYKMCSR